MKIEYTSNNSGGDWWLKDEDWYNLEKAGWKIHWIKDDESYGKRSDGDGRWLGALAKSCEKDFETVSMALKEFEKITKQDISDEGCNCCGAPHEFSWDGGYASGEELLQYLYPDKKIPKTLREAIGS